jgi:hypothetical protein
MEGIAAIVTTPDPGAALRAAFEDARTHRSTIPGVVRRGLSSWVILAVAVAGWDATRSITLPLVLGIVVTPVVLALARAASGRAGGGPPDEAPTAGLWLVAAGATVLGAGLLALAGAGASAAMLAVGSAILVAWGIGRERVEATPGSRALLAAIEGLALPAFAAGVAGLVGALLPPGEARPVGGPGVPWAWLLALIAWRVARSAVDLAGASTRAAALARSGLGWVVVGGTVGAVLAAATQGPLGLFVAVALLPGILLGPMLARGRPHAAALEARTLDRLVLPWIVVLLLVEWQILLVDPWPAAILVTAAAAGYVLLAILLVRLLTRRRRPRDADAATLADPSLLIVLPLVRSIRDLRPLVLALRSQTYADTRVVVAALPGVDVSVVAEWLGEDAILPVGTPPERWEPAAWARHVALTNEPVGSDLALIVDARTVLAPVAARVLVEHVRATRVDAVGAIPRNALPTFTDRLAGDGPILWRFGWEPRWWVALTRGRPRRLVGPDAALVLVRVPAYRALIDRVGQGAVSTNGLLRALADDGRRIGLVHAADLAVRRGEVGVTGALHWWRSTAVILAGGTIADTVAMLLLVVLGWVAPLALPLAAVAADTPPGLVAMSLVPLGLLVMARVLLAATQRSSVRAIAAHPVMAMTAVVGIGAALADHASGTHAQSIPDGGARLVAPPDPALDSPT